MKFNLKVLLPPLLTPDLSKAPILLLCFGFPSWPFFLSCFYSVTTFSGLFLSSWVDSFLLLQLLTVLLLWPHLIMNVCVCFVHVWFLNVFLSYFWTSVCVSMILCVCVGEEVKVGDIPKPSLPSILPKKPLPPKISSSPSSLPPRRPERPPTLASVHTHAHMLLRRKNPTYLWAYKA